MDKKDSGIASAERTGRHDVIFFFKLKNSSSNHSCKARDGPDAYCKHCIEGTYAEHCDDKHCKKDSGESEQDIHNTHYRVIELFVITCEKSAKNADCKSHCGGNKSYHKGNSSAVKKTGENVASEVIGSEKMSLSINILGFYSPHLSSFFFVNSPETGTKTKRRVLLIISVIGDHRSKDYEKDLNKKNEEAKCCHLVFYKLLKSRFQRIFAFYVFHFLSSLPFIHI